MAPEPLPRRSRFLGRTSQRERVELMERLIALRGEYWHDPGTTSIVDTYIVYATVGRDRKKLGLEWAELCEKAIAEGKEFREAVSR